VLLGVEIDDVESVPIIKCRVHALVT
jgi:hypothetical protein